MDPPPVSATSLVRAEDTTSSSFTADGESVTESHKQAKPKNKSKKIRTSLQDAAEILSEMCRTLEKLGPEDPLKLTDRTKQFKLQIKRVNKLLRKVGGLIPQNPEYRLKSLPLALLETIDAGKAPHTWMKQTLLTLKRENARARGELLALGSLATTLGALLNNPDLVLTEPLPPKMLPGEEVPATWRSPIA